jgi:hypothetical protein
MPGLSFKHATGTPLAIGGRPARLRMTHSSCGIGVRHTIDAVIPPRPPEIAGTSSSPASVGRTHWYDNSRCESCFAACGLITHRVAGIADPGGAARRRRSTLRSRAHRAVSPRRCGTCDSCRRPTSRPPPRTEPRARGKEAATGVSRCCSRRWAVRRVHVSMTGAGQPLG